MVEHKVGKVIEDYKSGKVTPSDRYRVIILEQQQKLGLELRQARRLVSRTPKPDSKNIFIDL